MNIKRRAILLLLVSLPVLGLAGCATSRMDTSQAIHSADKQAVWSVLPFVNNTSTPYAGARAQQQLAALLGTHGVRQVIIAPDQSTEGPLPVGNNGRDQQQAVTWARSHHARYAVEGSVDEWHYKIGLEGQPAVGFTLQVVDLQDGTTVWSGAASATGGTHEGVALLSQRVLGQLIKRLFG